MSLSINQNIMAMNSYRNLSSTQNSLSKSLEKLSSGFRINRAADDAAGLAISEGLRSQVGGNKQAVRNAQDGISVVQTAEGALQEVHAILQRMRDLAVQGATDSNDEKARGNIKTELDQLNKELTRISNVTEFNGSKLLKGDIDDKGNTKLNFQVGANGNADNAIVLDLKDANVSEVAKKLQNKDAVAAVAGVYTTGDFSGMAQGDTFTVKIGGKTLTTGGLGASNTAIADVKAAIQNAIDGDSELNGKITVAVSTNALTFTEATGSEGKFLSAGASVSVTSNGTAQIAAGGSLGTAGVEAQGKSMSVENHQTAQALIGKIDEQIAYVSTARANLGAIQNRFEHTVTNLNVAVENLSASESRIRDTDMAQEMMQFTRNQILSQAGTAMLAQANQVPQGVLSLLR